MTRAPDMTAGSETREPAVLNQPKQPTVQKRLLQNGLRNKAVYETLPTILSNVTMQLAAASGSQTFCPRAITTARLRFAFAYTLALCS